MKIISLILTLLTVQVNAQFFKKDNGLAHTYSIIARDSATGEMAVGVQSHWFSVGNAVSWGEAGVGVVATQSFTNKSFGIRGLALLKDGKTASESLEFLLRDDEGREFRQVAIIDSKGTVAAHTGKNCIDYADHITGEGFSVQSNMMLTNTVCSSMAKAYRKSAGKPLAERIVLALQAAQKSGGDIRGKQSAALLVVAGKADGKPWDERLIDLRVDDHREPLLELERLLKVQRAYEHMNAGDLFVEKGDMLGAMSEYNKAMKQFPGNLEMQYWTAITLANNKKMTEAFKMLRKIYAKDPNWRELTRRLPKAGLLTVSPVDLQLLLQ